MIRTCKKCNQEKEIENFVRQGDKYRYKCRECANSERRTGCENTGRFKKGNRSLNPFKKGHISWSKLNKGKYFLGRKSNNRNSLNYLDWVENVKKRDSYKCRECESTQFLEAHHVYSYDEYPRKRCDISNGVTLCRSCHKKIECMVKRLNNCIITWDK